MWGKDLGLVWPVPAHVSQRVSRLVVLMPGWSQAGPVKPVSTAYSVWYRDCSWPIRLPRRFCTFALHCISLGACGSSHHRFSPILQSRLRYLALAPTCAQLRAAAYPSQCVISWSPPPPPPYTTHSRASITYRDLCHFQPDHFVCQPYWLCWRLRCPCQSLR